jgi:hypothetical protein
MLIRMSESGIHEWPDVIGIWILADPSHGDCPETFSFEQINGLLHAGVGLLADKNISIEENAKNIIKEFLEIELPSNANWANATKLVERYNREVTDENMGMVSPDFF